MASPSPGAPILPDYVPVPRASLGPAVNDHGLLRRTRRAEPRTGSPTATTTQRSCTHRRTVSCCSTRPRTYIGHEHSASGAPSRSGVRHGPRAACSLRDNDPAKPAPEETFADQRTLEIGGERIALAWHGAKHSPDNIYIHFPDHDTLMLVDIALPGWVPFYGINLQRGRARLPGRPGHRAVLSRGRHLIAGHLGRLGTRDELVLHQQYIADVEAGARHGAGHRRPDRRTTRSTGRTCGPRSRATWTRWPMPPPCPSSRSTPAC